MRTFVEVLINSISSAFSLVLVAVGMMAIASTAAQAQSLTTLHSFCSSGSPCLDGAYPYYGSLIQGSDGNFYGMTQAGGSNGGGTVFNITPTDALTTLYNFCTQASCADGSSFANGFSPFSGLIQSSDGNFYGTTSSGGVPCSVSTSGCGTVFKISPTGTLTTLYSFCSQTGCSDGAFPYAGLIQGTDGDFYGTTQTGGTTAASPGSSGGGTIFKITAAGALTTLYSFCASSGCPDGASPEGGLVQGSDGDFYGTTSGGGANKQGTVFRISSGGTFSSLYSFCAQSGCADGAGPTFGSLVQASDGNFYGTTSTGGNFEGTVFKVTPIGVLTTLYTFCPQNDCANGKNPTSGLIQASDGNLYGTTGNGGPNGGDYGTVYKITLDGNLTTIYGFCSQPGCTDGFNPLAPVVEGTDGNLYGTTIHTGGAQDQGTVFKIATALPVSNPPAVTLSSNSVTFGMFQVGGLYPIPQVKLTDSGTGPLTISSIQKTGANSADFSESDNCPISPSNLAAGAACTITPNFTPAHLGPLTASISITDNATNSPQTIALSGTAVDFSIAVVPVSNTIKGGKAATYNISVTPLGGNTLTASLSVSGCPANASCTLSPSQLALNGSTASNSTLTVKGNGKTPSGNFTLKISAQVFTVVHSATAGLVVQ